MKSTDLMKSADDARRLLRGFKAFEEVAASLDAAGQAVQAKEEAERLLASLAPQIAAAESALSQAQDAAKTVREAAAEVADAARGVAVETTAAAKAEAVKIVADARAAADAVVEERKAAGLQAMSERDGALVKRDALLKECVELEARLAKAQASVAKLLG
jgi:hypothetical protein